MGVFAHSLGRPVAAGEGVAPSLQSRGGADSSAGVYATGRLSASVVVIVVVVDAGAVQGAKVSQRFPELHFYTDVSLSISFTFYYYFEFFYEQFLGQHFLLSFTCTVFIILDYSHEKKVFIVGDCFFFASFIWKPLFSSVQILCKTDRQTLPHYRLFCNFSLLAAQCVLSIISEFN